ncbi:histidinol-phosphate transaminase [Echinimonas agarilytica]|uniref:Histidinol-phosphate aminotransferase n=1 Tax=Echinimonas agarilytica TaxID=1215918 RepID=A0AA41W6C3_9GAMM|nr:histidinol-phosphate transaminase [Echinimonas agarilytica]MCM2679348.1 histidinol-phosphate transaminase [Echinimonas agarilytica]
MSCDYKALANKGVQGLHPYQAGKPTSELERELGITNIVKLASNENPLGVSTKVKKVLAGELDELSRYPDSNGYYLKSALAEQMMVKPEQVTLGNGSNDILELLARTFVNDSHEVIFSQHAFVVYPIVTQAIGATPVAVSAKNWGHDLDAMADAITERTKLIFIANPNNPTGTFLTSKALRHFLEQVPEHVIVVLDEAYYEYVAKDERAPSVQWLSHFPNLVVSRTFSKAYGLAGLRIGYAVTSEEIAGLINRVRQPFNCNSLSLAAAEAVLDDTDYLTASIEINRVGMKQLTEAFNAMGLEYIPSHGNFVTVDVQTNGAEVYDALLQEGVIVRPIGGYGLPNHLRVSIGLESENQRFIDALKKVLQLP